ncbi:MULTISPECIES: hypothetical protein [Lysinibacillus]|nr:MULTISPECIES: hypothetical protein [Lysinibacillus]SCZ11725.1 hypothetical protein SAMN02787078_04446 [Lysinibacillus sp. SG9]SDB39841.1 hypothetical protein SAMN02787079_03013 [Lysinibacillus sp. TC-37]SFT20444.1 hypothetical protein SAMN02787087_04455 [Lysinibacillus sp. SG55]
MQNLLHLLKELNVPQIESRVIIMPIDKTVDKPLIQYQQQLDLDNKQKD